MNDIIKTLKTTTYRAILITVYWPDDGKMVELSYGQVQSLLNGESLEVYGEGYGYDGASFQDTWYFCGDDEISFYVMYCGEDDDPVMGAVEGWSGAMKDAFVELLDLGSPQ
jgi:hypothetical protein